MGPATEISLRVTLRINAVTAVAAALFSDHPDLVIEVNYLGQMQRTKRRPLAELPGCPESPPCSCFDENFLFEASFDPAYWDEQRVLDYVHIKPITFTLLRSSSEGKYRVLLPLGNTRVHDSFEFLFPDFQEIQDRPNKVPHCLKACESDECSGFWIDLESSAVIQRPGTPPGFGFYFGEEIGHIEYASPITDYESSDSPQISEAASVHTSTHSSKQASSQASSPASSPAGSVQNSVHSSPQSSPCTSEHSSPHNSVHNSPCSSPQSSPDNSPHTPLQASPDNSVHNSLHDPQHASPPNPLHSIEPSDDDEWHESGEEIDGDADDCISRPAPVCSGRQVIHAPEEHSTFEDEADHLDIVQETTAAQRDTNQDLRDADEWRAKLLLLKQAAECELTKARKLRIHAESMCENARIRALLSKEERTTAHVIAPLDIDCAPHTQQSCGPSPPLKPPMDTAHQQPTTQPSKVDATHKAQVSGWAPDAWGVNPGVVITTDPTPRTIGCHCHPDMYKADLLNPPHVFRPQQMLRPWEVAVACPDDFWCRGFLHPEGLPPRRPCLHCAGTGLSRY